MTDEYNSPDVTIIYNVTDPDDKNTVCLDSVRAVEMYNGEGKVVKMMLGALDKVIGFFSSTTVNRN